MLIPLFVLLLGREEDKKTRSVLLVSQLVASKSKGCPLSAGCWSSLLRGSRIQQPNLKKGKKKALSRLDEAYLIMYEKAFPSRAYLVLVLRSNKTDALRLTLDWLERGEVRVRGMGFFSWCANAHFRFPFTSRGSRGSYAAAFPGPFLLVLRPEAIASS